MKIPFQLVLATNNLNKVAELNHLLQGDFKILTLKDVGFDGWISIEDGVDGMAQMHESADFLREKIKKYWPNYQPR
ncbi:MAG: hypothetical protein ACO306_07750 [Flavobacteriaceae bacterium]